MDSLFNYQAKIATPFAILGIATSGNYLTGIDYLSLANATLPAQNQLAQKVQKQIERYLRDPNYEFDLPLFVNGTVHQNKVWREISKIRPGQTLTYSDIATKVRSGPRAVGGACGSNPIPLIVPCHRVVAKNGLGGFARSRHGNYLDIKRWLLAHEHAG